MANVLTWGFHRLEDVYDQRITAVGVDVVSRAIDATLAEHNRQLNALIDLFCFRTTRYKTRFRTASAVRNQPLDEFGRAKPIQVGGYYDVELPVVRSGNAYGFTWEASRKMTVAEVDEKVSHMTMGDINWMRDHILGAAFYNGAGYTFIDEQYGTLTVKGLANGDTVTYTRTNGSSSTDTHYLAQAAAIADAANPFPTIYDELKEHPENRGQVIAFIPSNLRATVTALASYHPAPDPNLDLGANAERLVGRLGVNVPGELLGYEESKVWIVEWASLPDNYIIATTTDAERPIAIREDEDADLRGFRLIAERADHPWYERQFWRKAGFGGWNRAGAVAVRIGNASWAVPTGYTVPMP